MIKVGIIDYEAGNLQSVCNAFHFLGADAVLVTKPEELVGITHLVLPGQGEFGDCAAKLKGTGMFQLIPEWIAAKKPFLGICVGYQLLFEGSEECPEAQGLGILKGTCKKFTTVGLKVPHMGWNEVITESNHPIWEGLGENPYFYFVHSYYPEYTGKDALAFCSSYGVKFHCAVTKDNMVATQFHPEKSQHAGLQLLTNFLKLK